MKSRIVYPAPSFQPPNTCTEHEECIASQKREQAERFTDAAFAYLDSLSGGDICDDRSCLRCRISAVAYEVFANYCEGSNSDL